MNMKMTERALAVPGLLGSLGLLLNNLFFPGWGNPGTLAYTRYESHNHRMALGLALLAAGLLALWLRRWPALGRLGRAAAAPVGAGLAAMLAGNVAEFTLFTALPYGQGNLRAAAWSLFGLGLLIMLLGMAAAGVDAWRRGAPRWLALLLLAWLPAEILVFMAGPLLTASAVCTAGVCAWMLAGAPGSAPAVRKREMTV